MRSRKIQDVFFYLHRYLGLITGIILIIIGITGSLLVFQSEISDFFLGKQIGKITTQGQPLAIEIILDRVQNHYIQQPEIIPRRVYLPKTRNKPITITIKSKADEWATAYVNPYTGAILADSLSGKSIWQQFLTKIYGLHYGLLAGDIGYRFVGVVAFFICILIITGVFLWSGWLKLISGFRIKWNAHPKRVSFDIHKVLGIFTAAFLFLPVFTGFCWNLSEITRPIIYAATLSPMPVEDAKSIILDNKKVPLKPLKFSDRFLQLADSALPGFETAYISLPTDSDEPKSGTFIIRKRSSPDDISWDSSVFINQYSGKIIRVDNGLKMSLGMRFENSFVSLHYGRYWGLLSRILYVFVGLSPTILFLTGFVMWWYRRQNKKLAKSKILENVK
jgi:uncharacterized iron-regulated membrane protein